jgi:hypothetical protein
MIIAGLISAAGLLFLLFKFGVRRVTHVLIRRYIRRHDGSYGWRTSSIYNPLCTQSNHDSRTTHAR